MCNENRLYHNSKTEREKLHSVQIYLYSFVFSVLRVHLHKYVKAELIRGERELRIANCERVYENRHSLKHTH